MVIFDKFHEFSLDQDLSGAGIAGFFISDNTIDVRNSRVRDFGRGNLAMVRFTVTTAFTSGGAAVLSAALLLSSDAPANPLPPISNLVTLCATPLYTLDELDVVGAEFYLVIPPVPHLNVTAASGQQAEYRRQYLSVLYSVQTAQFTAGKLSARTCSDMGGARPPRHTIGYAGP